MEGLLLSHSDSYVVLPLLTMDSLGGEVYSYRKMKVEEISCLYKPREILIKARV